MVRYCRPWLLVALLIGGAPAAAQAQLVGVTKASDVVDRGDEGAAVAMGWTNSHLH